VVVNDIKQFGSGFETSHIAMLSYTTGVFELDHSIYILSRMVIKFLPNILENPYFLGFWSLTFPLPFG
jgi:tellurite resistance protein TehA-like permease